MHIRQAGGWALVGAAAMIVVGMAHHPQSLHSGLGRAVHALMILAIAVTGFGFTAFVVDRGTARATILAGSIAFALAASADIVAAIINGFIAPALALSGEPIGADIYLLTWAANQSFAWIGVIATGVAFLFWSADILRRPGPFSRMTGVLGLAAAIVPIGLLLTGVLRMNVTGALLVYVTQALWGALVGIQMLQSRPLEKQPR